MSVDNITIFKTAVTYTKVLSMYEINEDTEEITLGFTSRIFFDRELDLYFYKRIKSEGCTVYIINNLCEVKYIIRPKIPKKTEFVMIVNGDTLKDHNIELRYPF